METKTYQICQEVDFGCYSTISTHECVNFKEFEPIYQEFLKTGSSTCTYAVYNGEEFVMRRRGHLNITVGDVK